MAREAVGWLTDALEEWHAGPGRLMDAYLLLVTSEAPSGDELLAWVNQFELETTVCRRHVVWPDESGWDRRLEQVTLLGLPAAGKIDADASEPLLPARAVQVLNLLNAKTPIAAVIQQIRASAEAAAGQPNAD